jgi:class 3 adenylate cyclase
MQRPEGLGRLPPDLLAELLDHTTRPWPHGADALFACCTLLRAHGVPLAWAESRIPIVHPTLRWGSAQWSETTGGRWFVVLDAERREETADERERPGSPLRTGVVSQWQGALERLDPAVIAHWSQPSERMDAPVAVVVPGATDARLAMLDIDTDARALFLFGTAAPGGFRPEQVEAIHAAIWGFGPIARLARQRAIARAIAQTYIGPKTGELVLNGRLLLGQIERRSAVVWFSDLRGFTALSVARPPEEVIRRINAMYARVSHAVHHAGGEVLKLIGDAVLAIFPYEPEFGAVDAVQQALKAADACRDLPDELAIGIGLHLGELAYGNVGAPDRLDFTVIGRTVNVASRIEGMTGVLGRRVLASAEVAERAPGRFTPLGAHPLKGLPEAVPLFGLQDATGWSHLPSHIPAAEPDAVRGADAVRAERPSDA